MFTAVVTQPIDPAVIIGRAGDVEDGAVLLFLGVVRDHNDGRSVSGMEYEAYTEMAERVLDEIAREAAHVLGTERVAVVHRTGVLEIGEVSVAIAVSSPHRSQAFDASRYVIEEIKRRLPVWKREHYLDGERTWLPGHTPDPAAGPALPPATLTPDGGQRS